MTRKQQKMTQYEEICVKDNEECLLDIVHEDIIEKMLYVWFCNIMIHE